MGTGVELVSIGVIKLLIFQGRITRCGVFWEKLKLIDNHFSFGSAVQKTRHVATLNGHFGPIIRLLQKIQLNYSNVKSTLSWQIEALLFFALVLAAIFAAIPIMAPHIVCIFGFLELYFAERETAAAILFVVASFAPKAFADAAFYRELR